MAEKWSVPPWEIAPGHSHLYWFARWQFFETQRNEVEAQKGK